MTSDELKAKKKAKLDALIKMAEENIKNNPALRIMRDDYVPPSERESDEDKEIQRQLTVKKLEDAAENIKRKRAERAAAREVFEVTPLDPEKVAYAKAHPVVLDNWELEKERINAAENIGMGIMKKEMNEWVIERNKDITNKYNKEVWTAIISYVNMGFDPGNIYPLNIPEIIKELKPSKEHLTNYKLRHYVPSRFFDLSNIEQLKKYYHPKNLYLKKDEDD